MWIKTQKEPGSGIVRICNCSSRIVVRGRLNERQQSSRSCLLFPCRLHLSFHGPAAAHGHRTSAHNSRAIFSGAGRCHRSGSQERPARPGFQERRLHCNESGLPKLGASAEFLGQESLFRPALEHLEKNDRVGVAHWCDNGNSQLDLLPTEDRDNAIRQLAETLRPIPFEGGTSASDEAGEQAFRKLIRLIIRDAYRRNPKPLPVIVFLHGDHTGQPHGELNKLVDDFLETSGIVFGIRDYRSPNLHFIIGEQAKIMHYMAKHTGGQYFTVPPSEYERALDTILMQLHFRYELGFIPPAIDGKRHKLKVELTKTAKKRHNGVRLRFRPEHIPVTQEPEWAQ